MYSMIPHRERRSWWYSVTDCAQQGLLRYGLRTIAIVLTSFSATAQSPARWALCGDTPKAEEKMNRLLIFLLLIFSVSESKSQSNEFRDFRYNHPYSTLKFAMRV